MVLWFRGDFYNSHHCFLTYLQWGVKNTCFFPMNSSFCSPKTPVFLTVFLWKLCFVWVSAAQNVTVLFFCLDCLTCCVSLTKLCLSKSAMKHAAMSASGAIATYEYKWVCPWMYFAIYWVCNVSLAPYAVNGTCMH